MDFIISQKDAQALLDYLIIQPYKDTWQLVGILQNMKEVPKAGPAESIPKKVNSKNKQ